MTDDRQPDLFDAPLRAADKPKTKTATIPEPVPDFPQHIDDELTAAGELDACFFLACLFNEYAGRVERFKIDPGECGVVVPDEDGDGGTIEDADPAQIDAIVSVLVRGGYLRRWPSKRGLPRYSFGPRMTGASPLSLVNEAAA